MPVNLSSNDVAWILNQIGITPKRHGKEDVYSGDYQGKNRVVIVPRNKKSQVSLQDFEEINLISSNV